MLFATHLSVISRDVLHVLALSLFMSPDLFHRETSISPSFTSLPTLHFVEPGLKISSEEWIKVMDEYTVPNCAALIERVRKFLLILDNAPSHAYRLACEHSVAWHS